MSPDLGPLPELAWLPVERCGVDPAYQRLLNNARSKKLIGKIAAEFRWALFQALQATPGGPGWLVFDGQHRLAAARLLGIAHVPSIVVIELSQAAQAAAFVGANRDRVPVSAQVLHHAQLLAGEPKAMAIGRICKAAGIELLRYHIGAKLVPPGKTTAVWALGELLRLYGEEAATTAVSSLASAWRQERMALRSPILLGVGAYLAGGGQAADLTRALRKEGYARLDAIITGERNGRQGVQIVATTMRRWVEGVPPPPVLTPAPLPLPAAPAPAPAVEPPRRLRSIFEDDPRASRDHGSAGKLGRAEPFGRSAAGSSLA